MSAGSSALRYLLGKMTMGTHNSKISNKKKDLNLDMLTGSELASFTHPQFIPDFPQAF